MPIYEYFCPECNKRTERILSFGDSDVLQQCECGEMMTRLVSLPMPAIFALTNRNSLVNTLNNDDKAYQVPGSERQKQRYKKVIGTSLNREKAVVGKGFG